MSNKSEESSVQELEREAAAKRPTTSQRAHSPVWQKIEAASQLYFSLCRQTARAISALEGRKKP